MTLARKDFAGAAVQTTLSAGIDASVTSIPITDATGWSVGANGVFGVVIDPGLAGEEKLIIQSRSGTVCTVRTSPSTGRGADGTSASAHAAGAIIHQVLFATDLDDDNAHVYDTARDDHTQYLNNTRHDTTTRHGVAALGAPAAPADIGTAAAAGTVGHTRAYDDHVHKIGTAAINNAGMFAAGVVDANAIATDAVGTAEIAANAVTASELADGAVDTAAILDANVTVAKLVDGSITPAKLTTNYPLGVVGTDSQAADSSANAGAEAAVAGLSITWVAPASRTYEVWFHPRLNGTADGDEGTVRVKLDGGIIAIQAITCTHASRNYGGSLVAFITPTAASHTITVTITKNNGTSVFIGAGAQLIVKDIGAG